MSGCNGKFTEIAIKALFRGIENQGRNSEAWVAALNASELLADADGLFYSNDMKYLSRIDLAAMQDRDPVIGRVKQIRESRQVLTEGDRRQEIKKYVDSFGSGGLCI